ncbi:MAG: N-6 DNA methylase [Gracilibacteraceae bacterium]|jgi:type I restriction-modification system DNA methylase subunit|nr:N-6 DNA methylase [Gracilibacteraceae bacterium]
MDPIETIIMTLGFSNSKNLHYPGDDTAKLINNHSIQKIIDELDPEAYYYVDDKPFILFFECRGNKLSADVVKKIWNAQIPLAVVVFENHIKIFNGCSLSKDHELILLETIEGINQLNETSLFSYWNISSAAFWEKYTTALTTPKLDAVMLENIKDATNMLKRSGCAPFAVQLILRLIFIRYLIDRGVDLDYKGLNGNVEYSQKYLLELIQTKEKIYDLFAHLKNRFNGNLFEIYQGNSKSEPDMIDDASLRMLYDLMSGTLVLSSGQPSLFPMYDFNIISVELISNIYERFLGDAKQHDDKAFYTPPYLVDYLLKQTIIPFLSDNKSCKILDPACGSGIFLVESARKIIENNLRHSQSNFGDTELISCITDNIWGIDKNHEAIDVAVFSIYLTILDYKDPKTLKNFKLPLLKGRNFFACDFFSGDADKVLGEKHFDFIIGNPPWGGTDGLHVKYCTDRKLPKQNNEISRSFVLRTKDFAASDTCCCLIVTSKLFYNTKTPAGDFRKWLLEESKINKYIELAAVRELIFAKARGPAGVIIYNFNSDKKQNALNEISHLTLKPNIFFKLFNIIVIDKSDYKFIQQSFLLKNDWAWKTVVFGYGHDCRLISDLMQNYLSIDNIIEANGFSHGTGIKASDGEQDAKHLLGRKLIDAKDIFPFHVDVNYLAEFQKEKIDRTRKNNAQLFNPPYALIKKGFDIQTYRFRAAFTNADFIYPDAVTGICGGNINENALLSFVGLFNSSLYAYLNLMLGSSSGIEREQGLPTEIFKYPALVDEQIAGVVKDIQNVIEAEKAAVFNNTSENEQLIHDLDALILEKFDLSNDLFVDYALNIQIPLIANSRLIWSKVSTQQLIAYSNIFTEYFGKIFSNGEKYIVTKIYTGVAGHYCAVEFVFQDDKPLNPIIEIKEDKAYLSWVSKFMLNEINDLFYQMKDVINFEENSFFILKTDEYKNWHPAMAKLELADVLDSIFAGNAEGNL